MKITVDDTNKDMKKLNLGCGTDIRSGWVNLDRVSSNGADVVHDINQKPWPFDDCTFDYILCRDVIEHISDSGEIMEELHRVLKKDGICEIRVPHFTYHRGYEDPTHKKVFACRSFDFYTKDHPCNYYYSFSFSSCTSNLSFLKKRRFRIFFSKKKPFIRLLERLVNLSPRGQFLYESSFLRNIWPAENIIVRLKK